MAYVVDYAVQALCCGVAGRPPGRSSGRTVDEEELQAGFPSVGCVLEVCWMTGVPRLDLLSDSDPYVTAWVERDGKMIARRRSFPYLLNAKDPVFLSKRVLSSPVTLTEGALSTDELVLKIEDYDGRFSVMGDALIGVARVPVSALDAAAGDEVVCDVELTHNAEQAARNVPGARRKTKHRETTAAQSSAHASDTLEAVHTSSPETAVPHNNEASADDVAACVCRLSIRAWSATAMNWPDKRWIFLLRHGESKWNVAQHDVDIAGMLGDTDHGLSQVGLQQAEALAAKIKATRSPHRPGLDEGSLPADAPESVYQQFFAADRLYSSPLTRAVQTALVALQDHPSAAACGLTLRAELREVKTRFGRDTIGKVRGDDIGPHVHEELIGLCRGRSGDGTMFGGGPGETLLTSVRHIPVHSGNTNHDWWDDVKEDAHNIDDRVAELFTQIKYSLDERVVCAGHSMLFQHMCTQYTTPECSAASRDLLSALRAHKLPNCGMAALRVNFGGCHISKCVEEIHLLFGTTLPS